jgi:hypothetical protein
MTTPNGLAGCWLVLGFIASNRQPTRFINDPLIIDRTMISGADKRTDLQLQVGKRPRMSGLIHARARMRSLEARELTRCAKTLRCSIADLFKKSNRNVLLSVRSPGLRWGVAKKVIGSEA